MRTTTVCSSLAALVPLAAAHAAIPGLPRMWGRSVKGLDADVSVYPTAARLEPRAHFGPLRRTLQKRQKLNTEDQCGPNHGSCADGYCCSEGGWCGKGTDYCGAPDCQLDYGTGCDTFNKPKGAHTSGVPRALSNPSVRYGGGGISHCTVPGTLALTYDDGPYNFTENILKLLDKYNAKATFFITGNNLGKGEIDDPAYPWADIIRRAHGSGHQIASHTWSHQDLSKISTQLMENQIYYNEMALRNILGFFPQYMRPPYSSCTAKCTTLLKRLGYHITYFDLDTEDYLHPDAIQISEKYVAGNLTLPNKEWLVIGHDIVQQESYRLTEFMLKEFTRRGFKMVTVGECVGDPPANWYRYPNATAAVLPTGKPSDAPPPPRQPPRDVAPMNVSQDAQCGAKVQTTCLDSQFGDCCSQNGWCGSKADYCGAGCQAGFGACGAGATKEPVVAAPPPGGKQSSVDASCGGAKGYSCIGSGFGDCCSHAGWCGSKEPYCGAGCNPLFGTCTLSSIAPPSPPSPPPPSSAAPKPATTTAATPAKPTAPPPSKPTERPSPTASLPASAHQMEPWEKLPVGKNSTCGNGFRCGNSTPCCIQVYSTPPGNCVRRELCKGLAKWCKKDFGRCDL